MSLYTDIRNPKRMKPTDLSAIAIMRNANLFFSEMSQQLLDVLKHILKQTINFPQLW